MICHSNTIFIKVNQILDGDKTFNNNNNSDTIRVVKPVIPVKLIVIRKILEISLDPLNQSYKIRVLSVAINQFIKKRNKKEICLYE